ncbi:uncharacterized protein TRUGW13939_11865 [Talaromyces rugulosus]|uniref:Uncharacterized protein n=1 Tax=Talaromyces rugulosus TaxID=121627 RepID=A0A7H8RDX6_TALRU|nr:uncharacterized protein TRUGW13939_11865 [Talaromyces rugulosus]QKX64689.1 hypothetical protein TRUGW13939_11865 [Talaromyces rugulosus]
MQLTYVAFFSFFHLLISINASVDCNKFATDSVNKFQALVPLLEQIVPTIQNNSVLSHHLSQQKSFNLGYYTKNVTKTIDVINTATQLRKDQLHTELVQKCSQNSTDSHARRDHHHHHHKGGVLEEVLGDVSDIEDDIIEPVESAIGDVSDIENDIIKPVESDIDETGSLLGLDIITEILDLIMALLDSLLGGLGEIAGETFDDADNIAVEIDEDASDIAVSLVNIY